jgi:hypothetical protein
MAYAAKYEKGDVIIHNGQYVTIRRVRDRENDTPEYKLSVNGRVRWKDSAMIDRHSRRFKLPNNDYE